MDILTTREAAKILRVTPVRVRQIICEGKIEARKFGCDYVIAENSLESVKNYDKAGRQKNRTLMTAKLPAAKNLSKLFLMLCGS